MAGRENNFLMQFQADILNTHIQRAAIAETTALGNYLAGLATGFGKDLDEIKRMHKPSEEFDPQMSEKAVRTATLDGGAANLKATQLFKPKKNL